MPVVGTTERIRMVETSSALKVLVVLTDELVQGWATHHPRHIYPVWGCHIH